MFSVRPVTRQLVLERLGGPAALQVLGLQGRVGRGERPGDEGEQWLNIARHLPEIYAVEVAELA